MALFGLGQELLLYPGAPVAEIGYSMARSASTECLSPSLREALALQVDQRLGGTCPPLSARLPLPLLLPQPTHQQATPLVAPMKVAATVRGPFSLETFHAHPSSPPRTGHSVAPP